MKTIILIITLFSSGISIPLQADTIVVTADRIEASSADTASTIFAITEETIRDGMNSNAGIKVGLLPGVYVSNSSTSTLPATFFLRGTDSGQTLILLDGIIMNDPSSPGHGFDFSTLSLANIERIEVLSGSQSVLYGSSAIGGVINIITKKGSAPIPRVQITAGLGSFQKNMAAVQLSGATTDWKYSFGLENKSEEGFSAAADTLASPPDKDGSNLLTISSALTKSFSKKFKIDITGRYTSQENDIDERGGDGGDNSSRTLSRRDSYGKVQLAKQWEIIPAETALSFSISNHWKNDSDLPRFESTYQGSIEKLELQNNFLTSEKNSIIFGIERLTEKNNSPSVDLEKDNASTLSIFINDHYQGEKKFLSIGARSATSDNFGTHQTYRLAPGYCFTNYDIILRSSIASGIRTPTLTDLYDELYGNKNLRPEKSLSYDLGVEKKFKNFITLTSTFFHIDITDQIYYPPPSWRPINGSKAKISGWENRAVINFSPNFSWENQFTRFYTHDMQTGNQLYRRPSMTFNSQLLYEANSGLLGKLSYQLIGRRDDYDAETNHRKGLPSFSLVNLHLAKKYHRKTNLDIFLQLDNLLDYHYQEIDGYNSAGRSFMAGLRWGI
ncbi:MAG: hypothetical protein A2504_13210 [Bdellovibrionales bacterium RIFOXYD12_FULL_39_22]|nr:MAG: hypothetical protein A2385_01010 [Bdellovibrionales bacterium RIFOXYB1_FULL_39_21]OFZ43586.1 MAG: hypothetical protein A2485_12680 [Bdellovibrionales bacterium RIFOXYC12_FULL_39_17]OFZ44605.1 MAG: hypothetical protein A2404_10370 [Bdellovibrionales bacterium RIFOXYC1_FULL_39_130]OFZ70578.1 MAG: hypothetical protein A2451_15170 [Bdellovibrionales bacterium RIFOXYC2_FULL_39_8]OFZ76364.1 MAG: hypothetical protein A2560_06990 [Bdellovibrionales bacterium RIFOXYD1_FULL_39_84]OFZ94630.1 MAG: